MAKSGAYKVHGATGIFSVGHTVRVPVFYDMWMRGETTAEFLGAYKSRKYKGIIMAKLLGIRSRKRFKVRMDDLEQAN